MDTAVNNGPTFNGNQSVDHLSTKFDHVIAISDYLVSDNNQLTFMKGDCLNVLDRVNKDWYWADLNGDTGYIPSNHVQDFSEYQKAEQWEDEEYFDSYNNLKLHLEMLNDLPRTKAYQDAIMKNADYVENKTVLDVGCGTGILSLFCARDGAAKRVYAIEASNISNHVSEVIKDNQLDHIITVYKGRVENTSLTEHVDIIVSEWMGTFLLFEFMIESVVYARDKWLKPDGVIWPSITRTIFVPCTTHQVYKDKVTIWEEQYGFNFSKFKEKAVQEFYHRPVIDYMINPNDYLSTPVIIKTIDMKTISIEELECWSTYFEFEVEKCGLCHAFGSWFDVEFWGSERKSEPVILSTSPTAPETHWKNVLFCLDEPHLVKKGDMIMGDFTVKRNSDLRRHMTIIIDFKILEKQGNNTKLISKEFKLWR